MATIPLGDFDAPRVSPRTNVSRVDTSGSTRAARAMERAGETLQGIASNQLAVEGQKREEEQRRREALARVDMVNAGADYEIRVRSEEQTSELQHLTVISNPSLRLKNNKTT